MLSLIWELIGSNRYHSQIIYENWAKCWTRLPVSFLWFTLLTLLLSHLFVNRHCRVQIFPNWVCIDHFGNTFNIWIDKRTITDDFLALPYIQVFAQDVFLQIGWRQNRTKFVYMFTLHPFVFMWFSFESSSGLFYFVRIADKIFRRRSNFSVDWQRRKKNWQNQMGGWTVATRTQHKLIHICISKFIIINLCNKQNLFIKMSNRLRSLSMMHVVIVDGTTSRFVSFTFSHCPCCRSLLYSWYLIFAMQTRFYWITRKI